MSAFPWLSSCPSLTSLMSLGQNLALFGITLILLFLHHHFYLYYNRYFHHHIQQLPSLVPLYTLPIHKLSYMFPDIPTYGGVITFSFLSHPFMDSLIDGGVLDLWPISPHFSILRLCSHASYTYSSVLVVVSITLSIRFPLCPLSRLLVLQVAAQVCTGLYRHGLILQST